jgi:hypothetical protein
VRHAAGQRADSASSIPTTQQTVSSGNDLGFTVRLRKYSTLAA